MLPLSFAKAITEPVKVMAPMATPRLSSTSDSRWMPSASTAVSAIPKESGA
jgi:hypothetical protein